MAHDLEMAGGADCPSQQPAWLLASLVHGGYFVTLPSDTPHSTDRANSRVPSASLADGLATTVLGLLRHQSSVLAARWSAQASTVLQSDRASTQEREQAEGLVTALLGGLGTDDGAPEDAIGHGMRFGAAAFNRGVSLYHVLKALDLLAAMTLYAAEAALEQADGISGTPADGVRMTRRLQRRGSLLTLAASRGYLQAFADTLRERFRHLRHDLRNPLGTIKSVLALMDDDSVPLEARVNPSFRAMATRNARSLEELIADRLSDAAALLPLVAGQDVSLRALACAVRRELRAEADAQGVTVIVEQGGPHGRLDAAGLELLLRDTLHAALRECDSGEQLHIDFEQPTGRVNVAVFTESGRAPVVDSTARRRLETLAKQIGATLTASERIVLSMQFQPGDTTTPAGERERSVPRGSTGLGDGDVRDDVRSTRERDHGQTGAH